jgi:hypothetical protein
MLPLPTNGNQPGLVHETELFGANGVDGRAQQEHLACGQQPNAGWQK